MSANDEILKREIIEKVGPEIGPFKARIFPEGSNFDQILFENGGLTFSHENLIYGSNDCVYVKKDNGGNEVPVMAIEASNCLRTGSSGNAQYQRFHHAYGAVKNGIIGVMYYPKGKHKPQPDLYGFTYKTSQQLNTSYLVIHDLKIIKNILLLLEKNPDEAQLYIEKIQSENFEIFKQNFEKLYKNKWEIFCDKRSRIIHGDKIIFYNMTNLENLTDSSLRAGHICVGEMLLTKAYFPEKDMIFLWPRMTNDDLKKVKNKKGDKEINILLNTKKLVLKTIDDLIDVPSELKEDFLFLRDKTLLGSNLKLKNKSTKRLHALIKSGDIKIS